MNRSKSLRMGMAVFFGALLFSPAAEANVILPLVVVTVPMMAVALLPIIAIESAVLILDLGLSIGRTVSAVVVANVVSTIAGIPIAFAALFLWEGPIASWAFGSAAPHALEPEEVPPFGRYMWISAPLAIAVLWIPFFLGSVYIEGHVVNALFGSAISGAAVADSLFRANLITYGILAAICAAFAVVVVWQESKLFRDGKRISPPMWLGDLMQEIAFEHPDWDAGRISDYLEDDYNKPEDLKRWAEEVLSAREEEKISKEEETAQLSTVAIVAGTENLQPAVPRPLPNDKTREPTERAEASSEKSAAPKIAAE